MGLIKRKSPRRKSSRRSSRRKSSRKSSRRRSKSRRKTFNRVVIGNLRKGSLRKFGFSIHNDEKQQKKALRKAVSAYGKTDVIKKLNVISILMKNTHPLLSTKFKKAMRYVQTL
jgi:hypothetical protein